jgi:hypothetical protein
MNKNWIIVIICNVFFIDFCDTITYSKCVPFADDIKMYRTIKFPEYCNVLQSYIFSTQAWCTAEFMKLGVSKAKVISFFRKTNILIYDYKLCLSSTTRAESIKDLEYFFIINFIFITTSTMPFSLY